MNIVIANGWISQLIEKIGLKELVLVLAVLVVGGMILAVFAGSFVKSIAKNINFGMIVAGILLTFIGAFLIESITAIFVFN